MRFLYFLLLILFCSCVINRKLDKSELSFMGVYSNLKINSNEIFEVDIVYAGDYYLFENDSLPIFKIAFNNYSSGDIVMDFPFNWYDEFINDPVLLEFVDRDQIGVKTLEFEDLNYSQVPILLPSKKSLTIRAIIKGETDSLSFCRLCLNYQEDQGKMKVLYCSNPDRLNK